MGAQAGGLSLGGGQTPGVFSNEALALTDVRQPSVLLCAGYKWVSQNQKEFCQTPVTHASFSCGRASPAPLGGGAGCLGEAGDVVKPVS